jgi:hypothetical protein
MLKDVTEVRPLDGYRLHIHFEDPDVGTICWPNGADIDPDVLYALVTGEPIPSFDQTAVPVAG